MFPLEPKHPQIRFVINSDIERFSTWAEALWARVMRPSFPDDFVFTYPREIPSEFTHRKEYAMFGDWGNWDIGKDEDDWKVITYELIEIGPERLQVEIICDYEGMFWFVRGTLHYVIETWPETIAQLEPLIELLDERTDKFLGASTDRSKSKRIEKRGQSRFPKERKLKALNDWDEMDRSEVTLDEFLESRFNGEVPKSTFHSWRTQLRRSGDYKN